MAQKMTLTSYLAQRGKKAKALTKGEADLLGIPYPLQGGWPRRHGAMEIEEGLLALLVAHAEAAHQAAKCKVRHTKVKTANPDQAHPPQAGAAPAAVKVSPVPGFVLRQARRYRSRRPAPWA